MRAMHAYKEYTKQDLGLYEQSQKWKGRKITSIGIKLISNESFEISTIAISEDITEIWPTVDA